MGMFSIRGISGKKKENDVDAGVSRDEAPLALGGEADSVIARRLDDVCRRLDSLTLRVDEIAHKVSDMEFKLGIFAQSENPHMTTAIGDIFDKLDEIEKKNEEKKRGR